MTKELKSRSSIIQESPKQRLDGQSEQLLKKQQSLLQQAKEAAAANEPRKMLEALYQSCVLDGLTRKIASRWPSLATEDVELSIAEAVDTLYVAISNGKQIHNITAYLWKVANNKLCDYHRLQQSQRYLTLEDLDRLADHSRELEDDSNSDTEDLNWKQSRAQVIAIVRSLLPRLGQHNIQNVMAYILEALEKNSRDIPNTEIAKSLGLSLDVVRQSKHRGFQRLEKIVRQQGLTSVVDVT